jgi:hypothetical protein
MRLRLRLRSKKLLIALRIPHALDLQHSSMQIMHESPQIRPCVMQAEPPMALAHQFLVLARQGLFQHQSLTS